MIKNFITIAWRNIVRQKLYAILNITGLALGLACCIIIFLYVSREFSYDSFHSKQERIFRVIQNVQDDKGWAWTGGAVAHTIKNEFNEIQETVSIQGISTYITYNDGNQTVTHRENSFFFADSSFFKVFDFNVIKGESITALKEPYKILITESTAEKYFGDNDPIGKELQTTGDFIFTVAGVLEDIPENSHLKFDFLTGMVSFKATEGFPLTSNFASYWWPMTWTYVLLDDAKSAVVINDELPEVMMTKRNPEEAKQFVLQLQPLKDIHLRSDLSNEPEPAGNLSVTYIFLAIAVFILVLACINFMNLSTARAMRRIKEIGVRKAMGAYKIQLIIQFYAESFIMNLMALLLAILIADLSLPMFNYLLEMNLALDLTGDYHLLVILITVLFISSFLSGFYPAIYLSKFRPSQTLKGGSISLGGRSLRKALVVFQFSLSIALMACTAVAYMQMQYLKNANLGFDQEHVLAIKSGQVVREKFDVLKEKLTKLPLVTGVAGASAKPGVEPGWGPSVEFPGSSTETPQYINQQNVDHNFFNMLGIEVIAGRGFSEEFNDEGTASLMRGRFPAHENRNFIVNESALKFMNKTAEEVIGMPLRVFTEEHGNLFSDTKGIVVGVVKDFQTTSLRQELNPTVFSPLRSSLGNEAEVVLVKLKPGNFSEALSEIQSVWDQVIKEVPLEFSFLEDDIDTQYKNEQRLSDTIGLFALIAIFISCLGLFGLSTYMAEVRIKEIGIRKVLGASEIKIIRLLSSDFLKLIIIAVIIAIPAGWYIMEDWLDNFVYRMDLNMFPFIAVSLVALFLAFLTISLQSYRAATVNPVDTLRNE